MGDSLEHGAVILVAPNEDLGDTSQTLHQQSSVVFRHCRVLLQHRVEIFQVGQGQFVARLRRRPKPAPN